MHTDSTGGIITFSGNVAVDPEIRFTQSGAQLANFVVLENRSRRGANPGEWEDLEPNRYRVQVWAGLAENVVESVRTGDRVTVTGIVTTDRWGRQGHRRGSHRPGHQGQRRRTLPEVPHRNSNQDPPPERGSRRERPGRRGANGGVGRHPSRLRPRGPRGSRRGVGAPPPCTTLAVSTASGSTTRHNGIISSLVPVRTSTTVRTNVDERKVRPCA